MDISFNNLGIEVTRRCNMGCAHCMRGEAQDHDISRKVIDKLLENVSFIGTLVFTGGEPTLNVDAIRYTLDVCRRKGIMVDGFYIVTNGKVVSDEFLITCIQWYSYVAECCGSTEICGVALSNDIFHAPIDSRNLSRLQSLSFFSEADKKVDWTRVPVLNLGRSRSLTGIPKRNENGMNPENFAQYVSQYGSELVFEDIVTVTVHGDLLCNCDYEYDNTDDIKIGSVFDSDWYRQYIYENQRVAS